MVGGKPATALSTKLNQHASRQAAALVRGTTLEM